VADAQETGLFGDVLGQDAGSDLCLHCACTAAKSAFQRLTVMRRFGSIRCSIQWVS